MALRESAIRITGKGFDIERRLKNPGDRYVILLAQDRDNPKGFRELRRYNKGFIARSNSFRNLKEFEIATLDDLSADSLEVTHIAYDGRVYKVGEGDITPPDDDRFTWIFSGAIRNTVYVPN